MIVPETVLRSIFSQIPDWVAADTLSYPIRYEWGSHADLLLYLEQQVGHKYPLIWLEEGEDEPNDSKHRLEKQARFFLAKNTENRGARNPTVWDSEFVDCLNPLLAKVKTCLRSSGVTYLDESKSYKVRRRANFTDAKTDEKKNFVTDIWNVIVLDIFIVFTEKANGQPDCIKQIKF